jgi:hypothetical protein
MNREKQYIRISMLDRHGIIGSRHEKARVKLYTMF